jgi:hypothetical protein
MGVLIVQRCKMGVNKTLFIVFFDRNNMYIYKVVNIDAKILNYQI